MNHRKTVLVSGLPYEIVFGCGFLPNANGGNSDNAGPRFVLAPSAVLCGSARSESGFNLSPAPATARF